MVASTGDLLLLGAANAGRPDLGSPAPPSEAALVAGHYLGVLAIPLYALGYWQVAVGLANGGERLARGVVLVGAYAAALGSAVHGITGVVLRAEGVAGASPSDPAAIVVRYGTLLIPLWVLLAGAMLLATALYVRAIRSRQTDFPGWMALCNPVSLVVLLVVLSLPSVWLRAFLVPAAPNVAHVVFFALTTAATWRTGRDVSTR